MALDITPYSVDTREWYDTVQPGIFNSMLTLPQADDVYFYVGARLFTWFPVINTKGITLSPDMVTDDMVSEFVGKQVNLLHDVSKVVGTVYAAARTESGAEAIFQMNREQCLVQGITLDQIRAGQFFSHVSIENYPDEDLSQYWIIDDQFNIVKRMSMKDGITAGLRRTTAKDPFLFQGKRVVQATVPEHFSGVGFVPNPSDRTAEVYAMVADDDTPDRVSTLTVLEAANTKEIASMTEAEIKQLKADLAAATDQVATLTSTLALKETASTESTTKVVALESALAEITAKLDALTVKETASALEIKGYKASDLVAKLVALKPVKDEAELAALKETAFMACDDGGVVKSLLQERELEFLRAQVAEQTAAAAAAAAEAVVVADADAGVDAAAQAEAATAAAQAVADAAAAQAIVDAAAAAAAAAAGSGKEIASTEDPLFKIAELTRLPIVPIHTGPVAKSGLLSDYV